MASKNDTKEKPKGLPTGVIVVIVLLIIGLIVGVMWYMRSTKGANAMNKVGTPAPSGNAAVASMPSANNVSASVPTVNAGGVARTGNQV